MNSLVHYRIDRTPTGLESNFTIDSVSGEISLEEPLDYEKLDPSLQGRIVLEVAAHDSGSPQKSSSVFVNITVEVRLDDDDHYYYCLRIRIIGLILLLLLLLLIIIITIIIIHW